jgi:hypothetical protein
MLNDAIPTRAINVSKDGNSGILGVAVGVGLDRGGGD